MKRNKFDSMKSETSLKDQLPSHRFWKVFKPNFKKKGNSYSCLMFFESRQKFTKEQAQSGI
jgi:hypothetical protein